MIMIDLKKFVDKKSFFLFGPRATGKSTLVSRQLSPSANIIDLLSSRLFLRLSAAPHELEAIIDAGDPRLIVIDEIPRIPELLNEVQRLIESRKIRFLLTGKFYFFDPGVTHTLAGTRVLDRNSD